MAQCHETEVFMRRSMVVGVGILSATLALGCATPADESMGTSDQMIDVAESEAQDNSHVVPDVVYGHKDGMALTFKVETDRRVQIEV